jgi:NAD(P)H-dependent FMN reductase
MNKPVQYSTLSTLDRISGQLQPGQIGTSTGHDFFAVYRTDVFALADALAEEELLEHMASFRREATGVDNTIWVSPKAHSRHAARVKVAIDPPDSLDPTSESATVAIHDGSVVAGDMPSGLLEQVRRFIELNRAALLDYWEQRIDTHQLSDRLKPIEGR